VAIEALILDFGEVLVRRQRESAVQHMAQLARLELGEFLERYWRHRPEYDGGLPGHEYWRRIVGGANIPAQELDGVVEALEEADYVSWSDYREEVWTLAAEFKAKHGRTAILSNGIAEVIGRVGAVRTLADYFDVVVVSYEVGCLKPAPRIYEICLNRLGVPAASALFVDDRLENLEGAERQGMQTLHFVGDESVAALRARIGG
jgi:putative hydrolase of the HAD superfamily